MRHTALDTYRCPTCLKPLAATSDAEEITDGALTCGGCALMFPVVNGIVRFVTSENYAANFGFQWSRFQRTQLDSHTGLGLSATRFWAETRWPQRLDGETVLEAGSGAGRFTEVLASTGARVFSFDYSAAVDANLMSHPGYDRVEFSQADIFQMPFAKGCFDRVVCLGVIQHTPDPRAAVRALVAALKPGGNLVFDCYPINPLTVLRGKYALRLITAGRDPERLFPLVERYFNFWYATLGGLRRVFGDRALYLSDVVGVCDYRHEHPELGAEFLREWALLDTFDMLSPCHDRPQRKSTLVRWLTEEGLVGIDVAAGYNGFEARARKPAL